MSYTLEERDGALYAKELFISNDAPVEVANWYQLTTPYEKFALWFASEEAARRFLGCALYPTGNPAVVFEHSKARGTRFFRASTGKPEHTETTPIPEPARRGRNPLVWYKGAWHKQTAKGLVKCEVIP